jgi:hypothetical protein
VSQLQKIKENEFSRKETMGKKIIIMDSWNQKFSGSIAEHWRSLGHQVIFNPQWEAMQEADLTFFYQADNTAVEGVIKPHTGRVFVQAVDIEAWAGQAASVDWTKVDGALFMAPHIKEMVNVGSTPWRIIKPGIDTDRFTLKTRVNDTPVRKIAYVVGERRIWDVKRLDIAFQLLKDLLTSGQVIWQLHVRGTYSSHEQYNAYCKYLEKDLGLDGHIFWYPDRVEDMNVWLEDKDYFLLPSTKEAFSYATAEAMSKGIKPILNNWQGSKETWGKHVCETQGQMLFEFLKGENNPQEYRQFVVDNYDQKRYFKELDSFMGLEVNS